MLRTSSYLAIALGLAAIGSAVIPAAAFSSQVFVGANPNIARQFHPATASATVQSSREASHIFNPSSPQPPIKIAGSSGMSPGAQIAQKGAAGASTTTKTAQVPISELPKDPVGSSKTTKTAQIPVSELPKAPAGTSTTVKTAQENCATNPKLCGPSLPPPPPIPHCEAMPSCPNPPPPPKPPHGKDDDDDNHHGPVVIFAPQLPVQVPVAVPVAVPPHMATATSSVAAAQPMPVITPHCVTTGNIPPLAAGIDQLLPTAQLSEADTTKVTELRQIIQVLSTDGKAAAARDVEEVAMNLLGYQKVWLRCGLGTFDWEQVADAGQHK
jgi:hypothetical protein